MSRTTQYIGLTNRAKNIITGMHGKPVETNNKTSGMFDEDIPLGEWHTPDGHVFKEVVQCEPWSSGPIILTYLMIDNVPCSDSKWILSPQTEQDINYKQGTYYI